jgi:hypothetical protein
VDAGQFDVFHHRGYKGIVAVGNGIGFGLDGVVQEFVDQNRPSGRKLHGCGDIALQHGVIMNDFHTPATQDVGWTNHQRVTDARGQTPGFFEAGGHA